MSVVECIHTSDRFVIIRVGDIVCINVYFPCSGTKDRSLLYSELLNDVWSWRSKYTECGCVIGGDFNIDLDLTSGVSKHVNKFIHNNSFLRCDVLFPSTVNYTYINESLNHSSKIDYFLCNAIKVCNFEIFEHNVNLSDHLPLLLSCTVHIAKSNAY